MNKGNNSRIHALLDGEADVAGCTAEESAELAGYRDALRRLEKSRVGAPAGLMAGITAALPAARQRTFREWLEEFLPQRRQWAAPALAGALAMLVAVFGVSHLTPRAQTPTQRVAVHFQIHAPGAQRVELLGDFNNWTPGAVRLQGPDASGHWTASVELPEGHYEYQFLVNGKTWVTDPNATTHRPDGFGRENAVVDVYEERS
jgi:hypothetical protein